MKLQNLAKRIKTLREQKNYSLSALAKKAGISKSNLSGIEEGKTNPTINTLWTIANALNVPFGELIEDKIIEKNIEINLIEKQENIEVYKMKLKNHHTQKAFPHPKNTKEDIFVIEGKILTGTFEKPKILNPNEIFSFNADRTHIYKAISKNATLIVTIHYFENRFKFYEDDIFDDDIEIEINSGVPIKRTDNLNFKPKDKNIKTIEYDGYIYCFKPKPYKRIKNVIDIIAPFSTSKEKKINILRHFLQLILDNVKNEIFDKRILYAKYAIENGDFEETLEVIKNIKITENEKFKSQIEEFKNLLNNLKNSTLTHKQNLKPYHLTSFNSGLYYET